MRHVSKPMTHKKKLAIICGGPSGERGISLNSARSIFDNLDKKKYEISILYCNPKLKFYPIAETQIYSNTPLDFDYKLHHVKSLSFQELTQFLKKHDIIFPAIHGTFGEDGQLQKLLEKIGVSYIGSDPNACKNTSNKYICQHLLQKHGFHTVQNYVIKKGDALPRLQRGKYVVKPLHGGSSLGVHYFTTLPELQKKLNQVFTYENRAIIEPYCEGKEFTLIILENAKGKAVSLLPTEIELVHDSFFNYRRKYLATNETRYYTPARFSPQIIKKIQHEGEKAFEILGLKDFARLDGWLNKDGSIWLSDINAISGMEQNSFLFQQAALLGLSHSQLLDYIINKKIQKFSKKQPSRENIPVLFGGNTAERQVSVMSGTNVWMKLKSSKKYKPIPLFLTRDQKIYSIPQFLCLQHTVEEIEEKIKLFRENSFQKKLQTYQKQILSKLKIQEKDLDEPLFSPKLTNLKEISQKYKFLFLGLHGGAGENGTLQKKLDTLSLQYNGPGAECSKLCMDKFLTGKKIEQTKIPGVKTAKKTLVQIYENPSQLWKNLQKQGFSSSLILKPRSDGCSAGVLRINNAEQFRKAINFFKGNHTFIPEKAIHQNHGQIDLPHKQLKEVLVEDFIITDKVQLKNLTITWKKITNWIEITVGFLGKREKLEVMQPSQTIADQETLSLEEKFMGGTGINLVPPPQKYVKPAIIKKAQERLKKTAIALGIEGYTRMDCFLHRLTGEILIIEANTLPALTPSTTFFQQAISLKKPLQPQQLLEKIIEAGKQKKNIDKKKHMRSQN